MASPEHAEDALTGAGLLLERLSQEDPPAALQLLTCMLAATAQPACYHPACQQSWQLQGQQPCKQSWQPPPVLQFLSAITEVLQHAASGATTSVTPNQRQSHLHAAAAAQQVVWLLQVMRAAAHQAAAMYSATLAAGPPGWLQHLDAARLRDVLDRLKSRPYVVSLASGYLA
ncbi:hypothetical protein HaLaN_06944, partial [Haematococcus lacustris]